VVRRYVWGEGIDECLKATVPDAANLVAGDEIDLYYHHNSLGSVVAVTKADGTVVESYRYSAFGKPTIFNGSNVEIATTAVEQPFMFTGARYDFEEGSGLYQMRLRYYDPVVGRFVSRDPLGLWGDPNQQGNGQGYCGHDPVNGVDPLGLDDHPDHAPTTPMKDVPIRKSGDGAKAPTNSDGKPLDMDQAERWLDLGFKLLSDYATYQGNGPRPHSNDENYKTGENTLGQRSKDPQNTMSDQEVADAARKTLDGILEDLKDGAIDIEFGAVARGQKGMTNPVTGKITIDPTKHRDEFDLAQSILHELIHRYGGVAEEYVELDEDRNAAQDWAQDIVEQFFWRPGRGRVPSECPPRPTEKVGQTRVR